MLNGVGIVDILSSPCIVTKDNVIVGVNYMFYELTGYCKDDFLNKPVGDLFSCLFKNSSEFLKLLDRKNKRKVYIFTKSKDVREVIISVNNSLNSGEKIYNISENINTNTSFCSKFSVLENMIEDNMVGIGIYSVPDLILLKRNQNYMDLFRQPYNKKEFSLGMSFKEMVSAKEYEKEIPKFMEVLITKKTYYGKEQSGLTCKVKDNYYDNTLMPVEECGELKYIVSIIEDVTEKVIEKKKNQELTREIHQQNHMRDDFLSLVSHEFKTPLTVINSAIQVMEYLYKDELTPNIERHMKKIKQNVFRQQRLVNNLLDVSSLHSGETKINKTNIDIVAVTKVVIESVLKHAIQKDVEISFQTNINKKVIGIDEEKYERILLNLLSNAVKFSPLKGKVSIEVKGKGGMVCVLVKDGGVGIPKDKQQAIFKRFEQVDSSLSRRAEGCGIGLPLSKLLVESLGGNISLTSKVGKGSIFKICFPQTRVCVEENMLSEYQIDKDSRLTKAICMEFADVY